MKAETGRFEGEKDQKRGRRPMDPSCPNTVTRIHHRRAEMTRAKRDKMALVYKLIQRWLFVGEISRFVRVSTSFSYFKLPCQVPSSPFSASARFEEYAQIRRIEQSLWARDVPGIRNRSARWRGREFILGETMILSRGTKRSRTVFSSCLRATVLEFYGLVLSLRVSGISEHLEYCKV